jgi:hypothetical protein
MTGGSASIAQRAGVSALALLAALMLISGCTAMPTARSAVATTAEPASEIEISVLYALTAEAGTLTPIDGATTRFTLTLSESDTHTIWFSDRPAHISGTMPTADFVADWAGFGFQAVPPNVAIVLHDGADEADTLLAELTHPAFDVSTKTFTATLEVEDEETDSAGKAEFEHFAADGDPRLPATFDGVSVFINDTSGTVKDGCLIAPHMNC